MVKKDYDEFCDNICSFFVAYDKKIGFNELHRELNRTGLKISKPTLSEHLKHLLRNKFLTRKKEGKQRVNYQFNWAMFENLREARKDDKTMEAYLENKKTVQSFPLDEQLMYVANVLSLKTVTMLRFRILSILEPDRHFIYSVESSLLNRYYESFVSWLLQSVKENKEDFREKALPLIEANIERLRDLVFDHRPDSAE